MTTFLQDLRFGLRLLARQPGFTLVAVLVLSLGIGATTAAFSIVNTLLLRPRVGHTTGELVGVYNRDTTRPDAYRVFSYGEYEDIAAADLFESLTGHSFGLAGWTENDNTRRVFTDIVTETYFETFGVSPVIGRTFTTEEARPGADVPVAIISHANWMRLGQPDDILSRAIELNGRMFTVVGVAPPGFGGTMVVATPEVWVPTGVYESVAFEMLTENMGETLADRDHRPLVLVGRLPEGVTQADVAPALASVTRLLAERDPTSRDHEVMVSSLSRLSVSTSPRDDAALTAPMSILVVLASLVLLIASFNLANMLFARARAREKEMAIRLAIGSSRGRLVRQVLTESVLLAGLGGLGGLLLSWWATRALFLLLPPTLPIALTFNTTPDVRILAATMGFALLGMVVFGLGPAWRMAQTDSLTAIKESGTDTSAGRRRWLRWLTTRDALVMGQLALTCVMLSVAGLFTRGALEGAKTDPGFTLDRGIIANVDTSLMGYNADRTRVIYETVLDELRVIPGVEAVSFASLMPFGEFGESRGVQKAGAPLRFGDPDAEGQLFSAAITSISTDYFDSVEVPILFGRDFTETEALVPDGARVAIIDEALARRLFDRPNAVGEFVQFSARDGGADPEPLQVVGVVGGVRSDLFTAEPDPHIYTPYGRAFRSNVYFHVRTSAPSADAEAAMLPAVRGALRAVDASVPIVTLQTRPMFRDANIMLVLLQAGAAVFAVFAGVALFLAVVGIYGVKSYLVSRRTREIGIRVALGAERRNVVGMVIREGLVLAGLGLAVGVGLSLLAGPAVRGLLFQGRALDLPVIAIAAVTLAASLMLASWLPAWRATRVPPTIALRTQ